MITGTDLLNYVNAGPEDSDFADTAVELAVALVSRFVGTSVVPEAVLDHSTLIVAAEIFGQRNAPNGYSNFTDGAQPVRVARDPMIGAYPVLRPFCGGGFA